jgi:hydrogenase maturation protease
MRVLVLGLGNDIYGDDGVGIEAVRRLRDEGTAGGQADDRVVFLECALSGVALLDVVRGYDALVIIDTIIREDPDTGRIHLLDGKDIRDVPGPSPHYISVPQTLALGNQLGLTMPGTVRVIGIEAKSLFRLGEGLSDEMNARIPAILEAARNVIRGLRDRP